MNIHDETKLAPVPERDKQAGEPMPTPWEIRTGLVWTERMLEALDKGVKGDVWFSLIDKVYRPRTLKIAWNLVRQNRGSAGVDRQSIEAFARHEKHHLERLHEELRTGSYQPRPVKRVWIDKPGSHEKRPLGIPSVRDRVVQAALRLVIEPIFEKEFLPQSYGFRPGRGCIDALREVDGLLKAGYTWVVDADLKGYFDSIPHDALMADMRLRIADGRVLGLIESFLKQDVLDGSELWEPESGTPQGGVISPLLANVYLHPVDVAVTAAGFRMVRYADDFVILCRSREEAEQALELARTLTGKRGLTLHPEKTRLVDATLKGVGFDFLGYHFERGLRWPRKKSLMKLKDKVRAKTRRTNGHSLARIISQVNRALREWFDYFKHSHWTTFRPIDQWVRRRLRSILRKRSKRRGISKGMDHHRWRNQFFHDSGLLNLGEARNLALQPPRG